MRMNLSSFALVFAFGCAAGFAGGWWLRPSTTAELGTRVVAVETTRLMPIPQELTVEIEEPLACKTTMKNGELLQCEAGLQIAFDRCNADRKTLRGECP